MFNLANLIALFEIAGSLVIAAYALVALVVLPRDGEIDRARILVIDGALNGLTIKVAASLLKTIDLHTWDQLLAFAGILALRTVLKWVLSWEKERLDNTMDR